MNPSMRLFGLSNVNLGEVLLPILVGEVEIYAHGTGEYSRVIGRPLAGVARAGRTFKLKSKFI